MKKLKDLNALEKSSVVKLSCTDYIADKIDEVANTRKRIVKSRLDGRYFYHEMKDGEVTACFELALSWTPFPDVLIFAWTPDDLHVCEMDSRNPGMVEYKALADEDIKPGMSCQADGVTVEFVDNGHIAVNGQKVMVEDCRRYTYKIQKRKILAADGARGLFRFLEHSARNDFLTAVFQILAEKYR